MPLSFQHETLDEIPENYRELYTEQNGKYFLSGISGVKSQFDIDRLQTSLVKEREDHRATKNRLTPWEGKDPEDVQKQLDRVAELEVMTKDKKEIEDKLEELAEARVKSRIAPTERELGRIKKEYEVLSSELLNLRREKVQRSVHDKIRSAAEKSKVRQEAVQDILLLADAVFEANDNGDVMTKDNPYGVTPGLSADVWLQDMQDKRPHWWPNSTGGGSTGGGGSGFAKNPWSADHWNMTEQGRVYATQGEAKAEQMARAAGTSLGGPKPTKK